MLVNQHCVRVAILFYINSYVGENDGPIYLSVLGEVYDVSTGKGMILC